MNDATDIASLTRSRLSSGDTAARAEGGATAGRGIANRRESRRWTYNRQLTVCIQHPGGGVSRMDVPAHNLSSTGLAFSAQGFVYVGSPCVIGLVARDGKASAVPAKVVRCSHVDGAVHEVAVRFARKLNIQPFVDLKQEVAAGGSGGLDPGNLRGRVLYVEDNEMDRYLLTTHLAGTAIECACVATAAEGEVAFAARLFDVVMTDLYLADGEDGAAFITKVRAEGFTGPVVLVSAEGVGPELGRARAAGASHQLLKPYDGKTLLELMAELHVLAGAVVDPEGLTSTIDDQPGMAAGIEQFVAYARGLSQELERLTLGGDLPGVRRACLAIKGSAPGFGYTALGDAAREAVRSLDATMSVGESRSRLRALALMCGLLVVPGKPKANVERMA